MMECEMAARGSTTAERNALTISERQRLVEDNLALAHFLVHRKWRWATRYSGIEYDDLVQEACLALVKSAAIYNADTHPKIPFGAYAQKMMGWGLRQFVDRWLNIDRDRQLRTAQSLDLLTAPVEEGGVGLEFADGKQRCPSYGPEVADLVDHAKRGLCSNRKVVARLYYEKEMNFREIAEVMGLSKQRVQQIHAKALDDLRNRLRAA